MDVSPADHRSASGEFAWQGWRVDADLIAGLISSAETALRPHRVGDRLFGDVATSLITDSGHRFNGVCIDTGSGTGFCAEHAAIAAMVTAGEYRIAAIVAVRRDEHGRLYDLPPCGRCREFIRQVDPANLATTVILEGQHCVPLAELLPINEWPQPEPEGRLRQRIVTVRATRVDGHHTSATHSRRLLSNSA